MSERTPEALRKLAEIAFRRAAAKVILRARQTGTPVIVWEDDQIRYRSPEDFPEISAQGWGELSAPPGE